MTTRRIARIITGFILLLVAAVIGGSFYMLAFSLRPDARMREKNATAYEYMYAEYPFLHQMFYLGFYLLCLCILGILSLNLFFTKQCGRFQTLSLIPGVQQ